VTFRARRQANYHAAAVPVINHNAIRSVGPDKTVCCRESGRGNVHEKSDELQECLCGVDTCDPARRERRTYGAGERERHGDAAIWYDMIKFPAADRGPITASGDDVRFFVERVHNEEKFESIDADTVDWKTDKTSPFVAT